MAALGSVAILGAGTQGRRLAYMWSSRGGAVHLIDQDAVQLRDAKLSVAKFRQSNALKSHVDGEVSLFAAENRSAAIEKAWLVVEMIDNLISSSCNKCVPESLAIKRSVIQDLDSIASGETIIASNSSSFTITEIMDGLHLRHPERFVSLHSYWPPETPAIEVMPSERTKASVVPLLMHECKSHGFSPYHVKKNSTGYIYNRIWAAIKREALFVAAEGVATPEEIDAIYKDVLKTPKGPFEQMDIVGLDVALDIENHYAEERSGLPEAPRQLLQKMISEGRLGVKNGRGFYSYESEDK